MTDTVIRIAIDPSAAEAGSRRVVRSFQAIERAAGAAKQAVDGVETSLSRLRRTALAIEGPRSETPSRLDGVGRLRAGADAARGLRNANFRLDGNGLANGVHGEVATAENFQQAAAPAAKFLARLLVDFVVGLLVAATHDAMRPRPKVETVPEEGADPGVEDLLQTGRASVELLAELSAKLERAQEELRRRTAPEVGASNSVFQMLTTELADLERRIAAILEERAAIREEAFGGPAVQPLEVAPSEILRLAELNLRQAQEVQRLALDVMLEALRLLREMQQGTARLAEENRREPLGRIPEARDETMPLLQETLRELMRWLRQNAVTAVQEQCCEEQRSQLRSPRSDALGNRDLFVRGPVPLGRAIQQGEAATRSFAEGARAALEDYADTAASVGAQVEGIFTTSFRGMEDALVAFVRTGKLEFGSLVDAILADLTRILVRRAILGPLSQAFAGLLGGGVGLGPQFTGADIGAQGSFAHGAVFGSGVVTRPTLFPMANGIGLMGEAGPEAVLPLKRLPGGDLGVRAQGGGGVVNNITVVNEAGAEVETSERRNPTGGVDSVIRLFKRDMQREIEQGGPLARSILSLTGASQAAVRR